MSKEKVSPTGKTVTDDLDFFCRELDSATTSLLLNLQLCQKQPNPLIKESNINTASLVRASHRLRDLSLVSSGYLLAENGQVKFSNNSVADAKLLVLFDSVHRIFKIDVLPY